MKMFKKFIAYFLLLVISLVVVPKELIHSFTEHSDTEDSIHFPNAPISVDVEHTHCDFLNINVPLYCFEFDFTQEILPTSYFNFNAYKTQSLVSSCVLNLSLRGPPQLV